MKRRHILALGLAVILVAAAVATTAGAKPGAHKKQISVAFVPPVIANPIIKALNDGVKLKAESLGMKFTTVGGQFDPQAQIIAVDSIVQRHFDAMAIWPLDPKGIQPSLDKVRKAGIALVVVETPSVKPYLANFDQQATVSRKAEAIYAANAAKKKFGSCQVGIIEGIPVVDVLRELNVGMEAGAKAAGCTILDKQINQKDNSDGARPIADAWKTKYGSKMNLILAYNDPSALGALSTVDANFNPLIAGGNGDDLAIKSIRAKTLFVTASSPNVDLGEGIAQVIYNSLVKHQKVPQQILLTPQLITQDNVGSYITPQQRLAQGPLQITFVPIGGGKAKLVAKVVKK
jgi:ABC-type sugar transport system substrate-binding protein